MSEEQTNTEAQSAKPGNYIEAACACNCVLISVTGLGGIDAALTLRDFVNDCLRNPCEQIILDLVACTGMNSTFMGTLVSCSGILGEHQAKMTIYNLSENCRDLLEMLGIDKILNLCGTCQPPDLNLTRMQIVPVAPRERLELVEQAHRSLIAADESNHERFGKFLQLLQEELNNKDSLL